AHNLIFEGHNIVGDGTTAQFTAMLTGKTELELPESRHGEKGAKPVDNYPWIWKKLTDAGYLTQWAEDEQHIGTFQFRLLGFRHKPVDYYMRPFYLYAESQHFRTTTTENELCFGNMTRLKTMLNWIQDFYNTYPNRLKWTLGFHAQYSHRDTNNLVSYADQELYEFLYEMNKTGHLDNTMLIIMSDHGQRYSELRSTYQGKLEERLPFMSIRMPSKFQQSTYVHNLRLNSHRLTTPFDIHETFFHMLDFNENYKSKTNRSYSLFQLIPTNRTCRDAGIESHWCACLQWKQIKDFQELPLINEIGQVVINYLNDLLSVVEEECARLELFKIHDVYELIPDKMMLKFSVSKDKDNRVRLFNEPEDAINALLKEQELKYYQIQLETRPGNGKFEVTLGYNSKHKKFDIEKKHMSRINEYGNTSHCIKFTKRKLSDICYCKKQ
ncbi:unnamed protein product, partial [Didymodactylos carnosus]